MSTRLQSVRPAWVTVWSLNLASVSENSQILTHYFLRSSRTMTTVSASKRHLIEEFAGADGLARLSISSTRIVALRTSSPVADISGLFLQK